MLLLLAVALADDPVPAPPAEPPPPVEAALDPDLLPAVLVSTFQPRAPEAAGLAALLESVVAERLRDEPTLALLRVEATPRFEEYDARIYMDACPPGEVIGCSFVVAERGGAAWAVTGSVTPADEGHRVTVDILDIDDARVVVSFQVTLAAGPDAAFAEAVRKVLLAAMRGEIGQVRDIREEGDDGDEEVYATPEELARQLAELSGELGDLGAVVSAPRGAIERPTYTVKDIAERMQGEGPKPWERLGMSPGGWLRYKNSGLPLDAWRRLAAGRSLQVLVRPMLGWWRGPFDQGFHGRYAYDNQLTVVDTYSAGFVTTGDGFAPQLEAGFGLLPVLDVAVAGGVVPGHITVDVSSTEAQATPVIYQSLTGWGGARATFAPFPVWRARPTVGFGLTAVRPPRADQLVALPAQVSPVEGQWLVYAEGSVGAEVRVAPRFDLFLRVPVDVLVAGANLRESRTTTTAALVPEPPRPGGAVAVGALVGGQVRIGGRRVRASALDALDEEP